MRVEIDARLAGETDALDERSVLVPDQQDKGAPRPGVLELDVDLAGGRREPHLKPDGGERVYDEELRKVRESNGHSPPSHRPQKALLERRSKKREVKSPLKFHAPMAAKRTALAVWENDLIHGHGTVKGTSGALGEMSVSWAARTEAPGGKTSPEELLAAAHAACFSMALSGALGRMQKPPARLSVSATATFDKVGDAWTVTTMELDVTGKVPGMTADEFQQAAIGASQGCPISRALKGNVAVSVHAKLE